MAEIVNLNRFRKDKARTEEAQKAAENRATHGRTKTEKKLDAARAEKAQKQLDDHRRETDDPGDGAA